MTSGGPREKGLFGIHFNFLCFFCFVLFCFVFFSYVDLNISYFSGRRRYGSEIPQYLHDRPRSFIDHCMERIQKAENSSQQVIQSTSAPGAFTVKVANNQKVTHEVFMGNEATLPRCTCKDFQKTKWPCKHFFGVFKYFPEWNFDSLPVEYTTNPFITLDERILSPIIASSTQSEEDIGLEKQATHVTVKHPAVGPLAPEFTPNHLLHESLEDLTEVYDTDTPPNSEDTQEKKGKTDRSSLLSEQSACREKLQVIRDRTYLVQDTAVLCKVRGLLDSIILDMQQSLVTEKGIPLEPTKESKKEKKAGDPTRGTKYLSLKKRKGKNKFSGRSGSKASIMRRTFMVNVPVSAPKTAEENRKKASNKHQSCDCDNHEAIVEEEVDPLETEKRADANDCTDGYIADDSITDVNSSTDDCTTDDPNGAIADCTGDANGATVDCTGDSNGATTDCTGDSDGATADCTSDANGATDAQTDFIMNEKGATTHEDHVQSSSPVIGSKRHANDEKKDSETDSGCEITGTTKNDIPPPKRRRQNLDNEDLALITNRKMLNDAVVNKAQGLLHEQFPGVGGLEDTTLGPLNMFSIQKGEFVQVLHDGGLHWVCISNIGCKEHEVNYYDSLSGSGVSWYLCKQIAAICHEDSELIINTKPVQKQNNSVDCGVYALAFATSLLNGVNPEERTYSVPNLRPHLLQCIQDGYMKVFPEEATARIERVRTTIIKLTLYCHCRMPWRPAEKRRTGMAMAECENCLRWFHQKCEGIAGSVFRDGASWMCKACSQGAM